MSRPLYIKSLEHIRALAKIITTQEVCLCDEDRVCDYCVHLCAARAHAEKVETELGIRVESDPPWFWCSKCDATFHKLDEPYFQMEHGYRYHTGTCDGPIDTIGEVDA